MYEFPNPDNIDFLILYNDLCRDGIPYNHVQGVTKKQLRDAGYSLHHIIPKSFDPSLEHDPENLVYLPFNDHANAHYYLWKGLETMEAAMAFWFIYVYGQKNLGYTIPSEDDFILREDVSHYLQLKRKK